MRFLIMTLISLTSLKTMAAQDNFNAMISEVSQQEARLHKKLLHSLQNTKVALAFNNRWDMIKATETVNAENGMSVRLVQATK